MALGPARYAHAIATCLPRVDGLCDAIWAVCLAYAGLHPGRPVPQVHVVFWARNSGGMATPEVQVLGLEVMCGPGTTPERFREAMRRIFKHETGHSFQHPSPLSAVYGADLLLLMTLLERTPDFIPRLTTGMQPNAAHVRRPFQLQGGGAAGAHRARPPGGDPGRERV